MCKVIVAKTTIVWAGSCANKTAVRVVRETRKDCTGADLRKRCVCERAVYGKGGLSERVALCEWEVCGMYAGQRVREWRVVFTGSLPECELPRSFGLSGG